MSKALFWAKRTNKLRLIKAEKHFSSTLNIPMEYLQQEYFRKEPESTVELDGADWLLLFLRVKKQQMA